MKCNYTKYLLIFIVVALISFAAYTRFLTKDNTNNWHHLHHQAYLALHDEKYEHVIELCNQAIEPDIAVIDRYFMLVKKAKALNKLHRYDEALKTSDLAVKIYPKKEEAYLVQVDALFNLGLEEELTTVLEEIELINPHTPLKPLLNALRAERGKAKY
jgi:tetratricopeptide (TPR) repeat protein